ncbi:dTMP kinase [Photobacterium phosphoreum]|uniref:dTMP kinase n=1 Tax=Photobacterium phosphoreum TaxID=659 RepID=UPI000D156065|nr:dTMP kinase [Photobacterium phosphoreum]PTB32361.1 thymidylate kinase [Photobacterium phosphoreum]
MFIVIEGLDGSGKSTVAQSLAKKLYAELLTTPGCCFKNIRNDLDLLYAENTIARQLFYISAVFKVSEKAKESISRGQDIVIDRYWLSTQVYHNWMSGGNCLQLQEIENKLLKPDLTVFLDLPLDERIKRVKARDNNTNEDIKTLTKKADKKLLWLYENMRNSKPVGNWLRVDASRDIEYIMDVILIKVQELNLF